MMGLIAGEGALPQLILERALEQKKQIFLLGIQGCCHPHLFSLAHKSSSLHLIEVGKAISLLKKHHCKELILAGRIEHKSVFSIPFWRLGWSAIKVWQRAPDWRCDSILGALCSVFQEKGIEVVDSTKYISKNLLGKGHLGGKKPSRRVLEDVAFGQKVARELSRLDIGQTVVVKNKAIIALEAMEGTDACLLRAGEIAGPGCVVVKLAKPHQDLRFDVPVVGKTTCENLMKIQAACLAIEAHKTIVLEESLFLDKKYAQISFLGI